MRGFETNEYEQRIKYEREHQISVLEREKEKLELKYKILEKR